MPIEWHAMEHDGTTYIVRDAPEGTAQLYVVAGYTRNARVVAQADHVLYEGQVVRPHYDEDTRLVEFGHDWAGTVGRATVAEWFDEPVVLLDKLRSGSGRLVPREDTSE
jgi:hypothetical protein